MLLLFSYLLTLWVDTILHGTYNAIIFVLLRSTKPLISYNKQYSLHSIFLWPILSLSLPSFWFSRKRSKPFLALALSFHVIIHKNINKYCMPFHYIYYRSCQWWCLMLYSLHTHKIWIERNFKIEDYDANRIKKIFERMIKIFMIVNSSIEIKLLHALYLSLCMSVYVV